MGLPPYPLLSPFRSRYAEGALLFQPTKPKKHFRRGSTATQPKPPKPVESAQPYTCFIPYLDADPESLDRQGLQNLKQILTRIKMIWPMVKLIINYEQKMLQM